MTPENYECRRCHCGMYVPDGYDPLDDDIRYCTDCAILVIEELTAERDKLVRIVDIARKATEPKVKVSERHPHWLKLVCTLWGDTNGCEKNKID